MPLRRRSIAGRSLSSSSAGGQRTARLASYRHCRPGSAHCRSGTGCPACGPDHRQIVPVQAAERRVQADVQVRSQRILMPFTVVGGSRPRRPAGCGCRHRRRERICTASRLAARRSLHIMLVSIRPLVFRRVTNHCAACTSLIRSWRSVGSPPVKVSWGTPRVAAFFQ